MIYDFTFAEQALRYLESGDNGIIREISETDAARHIFAHSQAYRTDLKLSTPYALVEYLLKKAAEKKNTAEILKKNIAYAKAEIAGKNYPEKICLQYLPRDFEYKGSLYFTCGYDIGVTFGGNASLNLAHGNFENDQNELKYYSVHELHHAGFTAIKKEMPTLNITSYAGMARIIEYFTHLEGMGVYAPLEERRKDNALNNDRDYTALIDKKLMKEYETQYFAIYSKFKNLPDKELAADDWNCLSEMSDGKRLWYTVGAMMAEKIDRTSGREHLVSLIAQPSENFIKEYGKN